MQIFDVKFFVFRIFFNCDMKLTGCDEHTLKNFQWTYVQQSIFFFKYTKVIESQVMLIKKSLSKQSKLVVVPTKTRQIAPIGSWGTG